MTMFDVLLTIAWIGVLAAGIGFAAWLHELGLRSTYTRDLIHIGAGIWVFGWPFWTSPVPAIAIPALALIAVLIAPRLAGRSRSVKLAVDSLAQGDERWSGIIGYVFTFAVFSAVAFLGGRHFMFAAGAALLALAWGDGVGGLIGRSFGRRLYRLPWAKPKTLEGTSAVALFAALGAVAAGFWLGGPPSPPVLLIAATAAIVEASSPRATDNLFVPLSVFLAASIGG